MLRLQYLSLFPLSLQRKSHLNQQSAFCTKFKSPTTRSHFIRINSPPPKLSMSHSSFSISDIEMRQGQKNVQLFLLTCLLPLVSVLPKFLTLDLAVGPLPSHPLAPHFSAHLSTQRCQPLSCKAFCI